MAKNKFKYYDVQMVSTIAEMIELAKNECPLKTAYKFKKDDGIFCLTYSAFIDRVYALGAFLAEKGYSDAHIACIAGNSIDWINAYFTVLRSSGVFVPIDRALPASDMINLINDSESKVVFVDAKAEEIIRENRALIPGAELFICFDRDEDDGEFISFSKAVAAGRKLDKSAYLACKSDPDALKLLVYTSGTTGMAKGVMLSEHNLVSCVCYGLMVSTVFETGLSVLPYNHTYESVADILVSFHHHSTLCINESLVAIMKNLRLYKPDYLYIVPAMAEKFYSRIIKEIESSGTREKFDSLISMSNGMRKIGIDKRRELFASIIDTFGGNLVKIVCGGAPIRPEISEFFDSIGISLVNGYGITECSPLVCANPDDDNNFKTAGIRLPCLEWKINEPNAEGEGEILVRGDSVMIGYYKNPELTAETIRDGWFYTGDYGIIDEDDHLIISGRKKNIIVLNNGKNIYPEEIEGYIQGIDYVNEVVVSGETDENGNESSLSAEVFLSEVRTPSEVLRSIKEACRELPIYKQITNVVIRNNEFEKTTTNKIKRPKKKEKESSKSKKQ